MSKERRYPKMTTISDSQEKKGLKIAERQNPDKPNYSQMVAGLIEKEYKRLFKTDVI